MQSPQCFSSRLSPSRGSDNQGLQSHRRFFGHLRQFDRSDIQHDLSYVSWIRGRQLFSSNVGFRLR